MEIGLCVQGELVQAPSLPHLSLKYMLVINIDTKQVSTWQEATTPRVFECLVERVNRDSNPNCNTTHMVLLRSESSLTLQKSWKGKSSRH